ncbi:hypothetical protein KI387_041088 [Taxus chinensis]|uniref:Uncharacterized protein n=1 Tax=Taxus chinensis TaxID=29808 RepID=A0AA38F903_TAXCH|nr:hypothetical protein KI387_041088 [Taxus chinensis]
MYGDSSSTVVDTSSQLKVFTIPPIDCDDAFLPDIAHLFVESPLWDEFLPNTRPLFVDPSPLSLQDIALIEPSFVDHLDDVLEDFVCTHGSAHTDFFGTSTIAHFSDNPPCLMGLSPFSRVMTCHF